MTVPDQTAAVLAASVPVIGRLHARMVTIVEQIENIQRRFHDGTATDDECLTLLSHLRALARTLTSCGEKLIAAQNEVIP